MNPAANATTRQVEVLVAFDERSKQPNVAGLYAEGHVETRSSAALTLPAASHGARRRQRIRLARERCASCRRWSSTLGDRDARTGAFAVRDGLAEGDTVLRYPNSTLKDGQAVQHWRRMPSPRRVVAEEK